MSQFIFLTFDLKVFPSSSYPRKDTEHGCAISPLNKGTTYYFDCELLEYVGGTCQIRVVWAIGNKTGYGWDIQDVLWEKNNNSIAQLLCQCSLVLVCIVVWLYKAKEKSAKRQLKLIWSSWSELNHNEM